jgi:DNA-binding NarL/FixJ family response regulator
MAIRVVLAEDNFLLRTAVEQLIATQDDLDLVAVCSDLPTLLAAIDEHHPDVVLTDIRMPPTGTDEGLQAAALLRTTSPQTGVVVLSQYAEPQYALDLLEKGAARRAYLLKERVSDVGQLVNAIRDVHRGGSVIDPVVVEALVAARSSRSPSPFDSLTPRERETLGEMAQGKSNAAIAAALFLTERAVEKHINAIFSKLNLTEEPDVNRRVKAVLLFLGEADGAAR